MINLLKKMLRRQPFVGQLRLFHWLFYKGYLSSDEFCIAFPLIGNFALYVNTKNLIDASIVFTGDYEPAIKTVFRSFIKSGDTVLDIGANIGFHTLYFSELVGVNGVVIAFEPIPQNYDALQKNLALNKTTNVQLQTLALGDKSEDMLIHINPDQINPGSYNLFEEGEKNLAIICKTGDEVIDNLQLQQLDFIKIDVEGYEQLVLKGLEKSIAKYRPKIVFEYDQIYQVRSGQEPDNMFTILNKYGYEYYHIKDNGLTKFRFNNKIKSANILAISYPL